MSCSHNHCCPSSSSSDDEPKISSSFHHHQHLRQVSEVSSSISTAPPTAPCSTAPCSETVSLTDDDPLYNNETETEQTEQEDCVFENGVLDLLVIGAGPHALSLLTRLIDDDPDLLTELERSYVMRRATRYRPRAEVRNHLKKRFDDSSSALSNTVSNRSKKVVNRNNTIVIDSHGSWMAQWEADFEAFGIEYLRSHEHLHPDPFDFQALSVWAEMQKRNSELKPMGCVDRDRCRKSGYYGPFVTPSTKLFSDFCSNLVDRYGLEDMVKKGTVVEVRVLEDTFDGPAEDDGNTSELSSSSKKQTLLEVILADGRRFRARRVVCAMGPGPAFQGMRATLPWWAEELEEALSVEEDNQTQQENQSTQTQEAPFQYPEPPAATDVLLPDSESESVVEDTVLDAAAASELSQSTSSSTSSTSPPFPVEIDTSDTQNNVPEFIPPPVRLQHSCTLSRWLLLPENRKLLHNRRILVVGGGQTSAHLAQTALSQGAGSVTLCSRKRINCKPYDVDVAFVGDRRPNFLQKFWELEDFRKRKMFNAKLRSGGSMSSEAYSDLLSKTSPGTGSDMNGNLTLIEENEVVQAHFLSNTNEIHVRFEDGKLAHFDFVWLATGGNFDMDLVPVFASLQKQHPISSIDGLPELQADLTWAPSVPVYVMGAFAQLQLGADALNLAGARSGGVVVARALLAESSLEAASSEEEQQLHGLGMQVKEDGIVSGFVSGFGSGREERVRNRRKGGKKSLKNKLTAERLAKIYGVSSVSENGEWKPECDCC